MHEPVLADDGCGYGYGCQDGYGPCGPYRGAVGRFEQAAGGDGSGCGMDGFGGNGCGCPWYASVYGLAMSRNEGRRLWTSYDSSNEANQLTNTQDIHLAWQGGGQISAGRRFCWCDSTWALEATYWSTEAFTGCVSTTSPNPPCLVSTPLRVFEVQFNGLPATDWFDDAKEHCLSRRDEFQNVEVNLIREQLNCCCNAPWDIAWSLGIRYFRFEENLTFASLQGGCNWGQDGGVHEAYLNDTITNSLLGCQFGFDAAYCLHDGMRLFISPKVGIYNDHMDQDFRAYLGNGVVATTGAAACPARTPCILPRRAGVPHANRYRRRLAILTMLECTEWAIASGHHRHCLGRRSVSAVHRRCTGDRPHRQSLQPGAARRFCRRELQLLDSA